MVQSPSVKMCNSSIHTWMLRLYPIHMLTKVVFAQVPGCWQKALHSWVRDKQLDVSWHGNWNELNVFSSFTPKSLERNMKWPKCMLCVQWVCFKAEELESGNPNIL